MIKIIMRFTGERILEQLEAMPLAMEIKQSDLAGIKTQWYSTPCERILELHMEFPDERALRDWDQSHPGRADRVQTLIDELAQGGFDYQEWGFKPGDPTTTPYQAPPGLMRL